MKEQRKAMKEEVNFYETRQVLEKLDAFHTLHHSFIWKSERVQNTTQLPKTYNTSETQVPKTLTI
jgi:hypothetical protein